MLFDPPATAAAKKLANSVDYEERRVPRGEHFLYVRDYAGAGDPFVCLHGFPDNLHIFDQLAACLAKAGRRVLLVDFLGYGSSDKPDGFEYSFRSEGEDVLAVLDGLGVGRAAIVGHDSGGSVALNFALDHPDRVSSIALLNCFYAETENLKLPELIELFGLPQVRRIAMAAVQDPKQLAWLLGVQRDGFGRDLDEVGRELATNILQPQIAENFSQHPSAGPAFAAMTAQVHPAARANAGRLDELRSLAAPVSLIWGPRDPYLTSAVAEELAASIPNSSLHFVDAGHWPQIEKPREVAGLILAGV